MASAAASLYTALRFSLPTMGVRLCRFCLHCLLCGWAPPPGYQTNEPVPLLWLRRRGTALALLAALLPLPGWKEEKSALPSDIITGKLLRHSSKQPAFTGQRCAKERPLLARSCGDRTVAGCGTYISFFCCEELPSSSNGWVHWPAFLCYCCAATSLRAPSCAASRCCRHSTFFRRLSTGRNGASTNRWTNRHMAWFSRYATSGRSPALYMFWVNTYCCSMVPTFPVTFCGEPLPSSHGVWRMVPHIHSRYWNSTCTAWGVITWREERGFDTTCLHRRPAAPRALPLCRPGVLYLCRRKVAIDLYSAHISNIAIPILHLLQYTAHLPVLASSRRCGIYCCDLQTLIYRRRDWRCW